MNVGIGWMDGGEGQGTGADTERAARQADVAVDRGGRGGGCRRARGGRLVTAARRGSPYRRRSYVAVRGGVAEPAPPPTRAHQRAPEAKGTRAPPSPPPPRHAGREPLPLR